MNRFVKNNLVLIIVLGISLVATIGLLVWTTMQYLQMWRYITQTENLREEIANLIKKTPAPVEGNIPLIETDRKLYERVAAQIRKPFGHPLQPALEQFISVLRRTDGEKVTLEKFKEEFTAEWTKNDKFAEQELNYSLFKRNFRNWDEAMRVFRSVAEKATAEPINDGNIDEVFQCAMGVQRRLGGKPENLLRMMTNFRNGMLELTKDKIQFDSEEATFFSFSFEGIDSGAASSGSSGMGPGVMGGGEGSQNDYQTDNYPMIAQHWEILSDIVKRSTESGITSFVSFRKRAVQPEKTGSFDVYHYSIEVTGTMESIRKLVGILDQAYHDNRVYVVRSIFLYQLEDDALLLVKPELALEKEAAEGRQMAMPEMPRTRRRGSAAPRESAEERQAREMEERQAREIAEREKSLPYYHRSGYGVPVVGKNGLVRAIIDVEYIMESGSGI